MNMMRSTARLVLGIVISACCLRGDLGIPAVQAVCKVVLNNGKTIEGIIPLSRGGYENRARSHGFCFQHDNGVYQLILFNLTFPTFSPRNYGAYKAGSSKLYQVRNVPVLERMEDSFNLNETNNILERKSVDIENFELRSEVVLFIELPVSLHVEWAGDEKVEAIRIRVDEIESFEFLSEPSEYWLKEIRLKRKALIKRMEDDEKQGNDWVDFAEPVWFHELRKNAKLFHDLDKFFR
jgi:hypothetical protein